MNALMQLLQAASNSAASNVSGPVDLLGAGLRKAGVPVPEDSLLSSRWMADRGLTKPVPNQLLQLAGETAGLLAPIGAAAKAPQIAGGLLHLADNAASPPTMLGPSSKQRGMALFNLDGLENGGVKTIRDAANSVAERLKANGFEVDLTHSGSAAGPSSYIRVYDPQTGRYLNTTYRFSGHSKGPWESQFVSDVATPDEFDQMLNASLAMRELGPSKFMSASAEATKAHASKTAQYWQEVARRAEQKLASGVALSNRERAALKRQSGG